ncbi:MAG TPA: flippase-like domain-containing protein [Rhodospirillales bacterium]|nr:flippase-like domain-containing protein [Rhodospirillales bacterium]
MNKKILFFIMKFAISAILIWFIAFNFDLGAAVERYKDIKFFYLLGAIIILSVLLVNNTARWIIVLNAIKADLPFRIAIKIIYISIFFNQTLPSTIGGDAFKIYLARKTGIDLKSAINGVMLERAIAFLGLILLVILSQPFLLARIGDDPVKYLFPALTVMALVGIVGLMLLDRLPKGFQTWRIISGLVHLASDTKRLFLSPQHACKAIFLGISGNILLAMSAYLTFRALSVEVSILDCLVLMPPVILFMTLPISIAGWGVREGAMVGAFAFVGILEGDTFVVSVLLGLINIIFALPGGLLWLKGEYNRAEVAEEVN